MSVIQWDHAENSDAPLTEKQLEAIYQIGAHDAQHDRASSPVKTTHETTNEQDSAGKSSDDSKVIRIELASQLYSWLNEVERNMISKDERENRQFLAFLDKKKSFCLKIVESLDETLQDLSMLKENYLIVSSKTKSLHDACEHLLKQQEDLSATVQGIENYLSYYTSVSIAEAELRSITIVSRDKLIPLLDKLDKSMGFFRTHMDFLESDSYLQRATTILSKALKLVVETFMKIVNRIIYELMDLHDVVTPDNSFILLHGRFRSQEPKIRPLTSLLEDRCDRHDEYMQALQQCHSFYLERREQLLIPVARNGISDLVEKYASDHCSLLRAGGAFMVHMCEDETRLFSQFFNPKLSVSLNRMLSKLCQPLYDAFRPMIIHINHVEILSELCDILRYELSEEHLSTTLSLSEIDMSAFSELCSNLLADVQERLIFRSHIYLKTQILGYEPCPGDLLYPEKLIMMNNIANSAAQSPSPTATSPSLSEGAALDLAISPGPNMSLSPADLHGMWYPTVRRTLVCLSKLSRCLDLDSFRGLAQECISACVQSLIKASQTISDRRSLADGQLFLIKHLLILREQMAPFNVEFSVKETSLDFSNYKDAALDILAQRGSGLFTLNRHNLLLRFLLETPNVIEVEVDSRRELDGVLKQTCEQFIAQVVAQLSGELPGFLDKVRTALMAPGARLADQDFAKPSLVKNVVSSAHRTLCDALGSRKPRQQQQQEGVDDQDKRLVHRLTIYLANPDTESILMRHIKNGVLHHWHSLCQMLIEHYSDEDRMIIACPTENQIRLLFQDT